MKWRNSKFKLMLVCLFTITLVLGLSGIVQAKEWSVSFNHDGSINASLPPGIAAKVISSAQAEGNVEVQNGHPKANGQANGNAKLKASVQVKANKQKNEENSVAPGPFLGVIKGQVREDTGMLPVIKPIGNALVIAWRAGHPGGPIIPLDSDQGEDESIRIYEKVLPQPVPPLHPHFVRWTVTDKSGYYKLADLPPGIYFMGCFADWYKPAYARVVVKTGGEVEQNFILKGPFGALGGQVTRCGSNNPVSGATVLAFPEDKISEVQQITHKGGTAGDNQELANMLTPQQKEALEKAAIYKTKTDQNGYYFIPFVEPGKYWVIAIKDNMYGYQEAKVEARNLAIVNICIRR